MRVARSGAGRVTSDVPGIDCGQECSSAFAITTPVTLTAAPDEGSAFAGWFGACEGVGPCEIAPGAAAVVAAVFTQLPPLPEGCDAIVPRSVPPPVEVAFGEAPMDSASDDTGEEFLLTTAPDGVGTLARAYHLVRVENGAATEVAARTLLYVNDPTTYSVPRAAEGQPVGFEVFRNEGTDYVFDVWAPDGTIPKTGSLTPPLQPGQTSQSTTYLIPPSGGIATMRWVFDHTGFVIRYGRFDVAGDASVADVPVDLDGTWLATWGVDLAGNVLLVGVNGFAGNGTNPLYGRWLDPAGSPVTDWFAVGDVYIRKPSLVVLHDGLALFDSEGGFSRVFRSLQPQAEIAPDWLNLRGTRRLALVRGGNGYVAMLGVMGDYGPPLYGPCAEGIEMLTSAGASCGCLAIPELLLRGRIHRVGRDGSLLTEQWNPDTGQPSFAVYLGLFR